MTTFDFTPLYRNTIGFDRIAELLDSATKVGNRTPNYPPYNIEMEDENHYQITLAVAGFKESELNIVFENGLLTVTGQKEEVSAEKEQRPKQFLYQGIANRNFERKFQVAEHVEVSGANLENGLLTVSLFRRVPEAMKPKQIAINSTVNSGAATPSQQPKSALDEKSRVA